MSLSVLFKCLLICSPIDVILLIFNTPSAFRIQLFWHAYCSMLNLSLIYRQKVLYKLFCCRCTWTLTLYVPCFWFITFPSQIIFLLERIWWICISVTCQHHCLHYIHCWICFKIGINATIFLQRTCECLSLDICR